jgi:hypothetical protein
MVRIFTNRLATAIPSRRAVDFSSLFILSLSISAMKITYFEDICTQKLTTDFPNSQKKIKIIFS